MNLLLTFDYELFGDGSGNVFKQMIEPTQQILEVCENHGIKTTLFFEVIEYIQLKKQWDSGNTMGYQKNPIQAIEQQVQNAVLKGHDIQLHIHPQWVNAQYEKGRWNLDMSNWRLGDFKVEQDYSLKKMLADGKKTLENLIRQVQPDYQCVAIRAGGYNIMPSDQVFQAMQRVGLKLDSSVYPGGFEDGSLSKYDYRKVALEKDFWWGDPKDIRKPYDAAKEIMEIPIFALRHPLWRKLMNLDKIKGILLRKSVAGSSVAQEKVAGKSLMEKFKMLFKKEAFTWDFCLFTRSLHKQFFKYIKRNLQDKRDTFVLIGHPKSFQNDKSLKQLIRLSQKQKDSFSFITLKDAYAAFNN